MAVEPATPASIKRSAVRSAAFIVTRQLLVQGTNVVGAILLTRVLSAAQFGLYSILVFLAQAIAVLGGSALALQIVRAPTPLSAHSIRVLFTGQLAVCVLLSIVLFLGAAPIADAFRLAHQESASFRIISAGVLLSCLQVIPTAMLERHLRFDRLAAVEIAQAVVFNVIAVGGAWAGLGVTGVAAGITARVLVGVCLLSYFQRWPIGIAIDWPVLRDEIGSGASYLTASFVSLAKDAINPLFLGLLLGASKVGLVNWAVMMSSYHLLALMMLQRLYIPAFSRLAPFPDELSRFLQNVIRLTNAVAAPVACLVLALIYPLTLHFFGQRWLPAIPIFFGFWLANLIVPTIHPLLSLLQALNRGRLVLTITTGWMVLTWLVGVPAILVLGAPGSAVANVVVQCTNVVVYREAKRMVRFSVLSRIWPFWAIAAGCAVAVVVLQRLLPIRSSSGVLAYLGAAALTYCVVVIMVFGREFRSAITLMRQSTLS